MAKIYGDTTTTPIKITLTADGAVDLSDYYTKTEVDDLVALGGGSADLSEYYNKTETDDKLSEKVDKVEGWDLVPKVDVGDYKQYPAVGMAFRMNTEENDPYAMHADWFYPASSVNAIVDKKTNDVKAESVAEIENAKTEISEEIASVEDKKLDKELYYYGSRFIHEMDKEYFIIDETTMTLTGLNVPEDESLPRHMVIPCGVEGIEREVFKDYVELEGIVIPKSVVYIGRDAFAGCVNLMDVTLGGSVDQWNQMSIGSGNDALVDAYNWVYDDSRGHYTKAETDILLSSKVSQDTYEESLGNFADHITLTEERFNGIDSEIANLKEIGSSVDLSEYEKLHGKIGLINAYNSVPIVIDSINKTITIKGNASTFLVSTSGQNIQIASAVTINMQHQNGAVVYNLTSGVFEVRPNNALGVLKTDDILILTYNQHGKFVNSLSMHTIDDNLYGIDLQPEYEMLSPNYEFINLPNVGFWSDFCFINNKLLIFVASGDEDHIKQNGTIVIINTETWQIEKTLLHDFGHCNTVDYNSETDTLLIGNLPGNTQYQGALYIFYDVSRWVDFENNHLLSFNELSPTIVDLQSLKTIYSDELLDKNIDNVVACWGGTNNGQNNIVYVNTQYNRDWFKLLLGKGSNNLGNGTFAEAEEAKFNGSFAALWHDKFNIPYIIGQEVTQGIIFDNGIISTSNGHNDIQFFDWSITNKGLTRCEYHDSIYNADASNKFCVSEGYTEKDGCRYVGCIFTTDEQRTIATGEYGILKIKKHGLANDGDSEMVLRSIDSVLDEIIALQVAKGGDSE